MKNPTDPPEPRLVSIEYFIRDMLGMDSRTWFYNHQNEPGFPQRVYPGGPKSRPMLVHDECVAYIERLMAARDGKKPEPGPKRHVGRPAALVKARRLPSGRG